MARPVLKGCHCQTVVEKIQGVLLAVVGLNIKLAITNDTLTDGTIGRKEPRCWCLRCITTLPQGIRGLGSAVAQLSVK